MPKSKKKQNKSYACRLIGYSPLALEAPYVREYYTINKLEALRTILEIYKSSIDDIKNGSIVIFVECYEICNLHPDEPPKLIVSLLIKPELKETYNE